MGDAFAHWDQIGVEAVGLDKVLGLVFSLSFGIATCDFLLMGLLCSLFDFVGDPSIARELGVVWAGGFCGDVDLDM